MKVTFEIPDSSKFARYRYRDGYRDLVGNWHNIDPEDVRTGPFGKWHIVSDSEPQQRACGATLPRLRAGIEGIQTRGSMPPAPEMCLRCLNKVMLGRKPVDDQTDWPPPMRRAGER